ncbi:uncharacterized protein ATC70_004209 [Mucor velutinosus]|uniref:Uncharacterized protein n=1 Tax=Mucor velutinosus TaxID=708070 RepID=A0AAN7I4Q5_9FUNG|nr:hypothetical protein ATC70_004209 [Mucor velutinosus]
MIIDKSSSLTYNLATILSNKNTASVVHMTYGVSKGSGIEACHAHGSGPLSSGFTIDDDDMRRYNLAFVLCKIGSHLPSPMMANLSSWISAIMLSASQAARIAVLQSKLIAKVHELDKELDKVGEMGVMTHILIDILTLCL